MRPPAVAVTALALTAAIAGTTAVAGARVETGFPIYCGAQTNRYVALTFDDGPRATTSRVVRTLERQQAHATFFVVGRNVAGRTSLIRREAALGEVGNHSWSHPDLSRYSRTAVFAQLQRTQQAIRRAGVAAPVVFRPPYGRRNATVDTAARSLALDEIRSSVDSLDWRGSSRDAIVRNVLGSVRPGSIVLMHDVIPRTAAALPRILLVLKARGFELLTVSELRRRDPPTPGQQRGLHGC